MLMDHTEYKLKQRNIKMRLNNHKAMDINNRSNDIQYEFKEFYVDNQIKKSFRYFESNYNIKGWTEQLREKMKEYVEEEDPDK